MPAVCEPVATKRGPTSDYDAKFSLPYGVASGLLRGRLGLSELEPRIADATALALMERVDCAVDPRPPSRATTPARCASRSMTAATLGIARP